LTSVLSSGPSPRSMSYVRDAVFLEIREPRSVSFVSLFDPTTAQTVQQHSVTVFHRHQCLFTGHQRCVIALQEENMRDWLSPAQFSRERLEAIFTAKETPYYEHRIAA